LRIPKRESSGERSRKSQFSSVRTDRSEDGGGPWTVHWKGGCSRGGKTSGMGFAIRFKTSGELIIRERVCRQGALFQRSSSRGVLHFFWENQVSLSSKKGRGESWEVVPTRRSSTLGKQKGPRKGGPYLRGEKHHARGKSTTSAL